MTCKFNTSAALLAAVALAVTAATAQAQENPLAAMEGARAEVSGTVPVMGYMREARAEGEKVDSTSEGARVFGGRPAQDGAWPAQVSLHFANIPDLSSESLFQSQFCGGTMITNQWVLTAAHCVVGQDGSTAAPESVLVRGHSNALDRGVVYSLEKVISHPGYDPVVIDNDIALLKLSQPVRNDGTIGTIPLITANSALPEGPAMVVGWGMMEDGKFPANLMETDIRVVSNATCNAGMAEQTRRDFGGFLLGMGRANRIPMQVLEQAFMLLTTNLGDALTENMICAGIPSGRQTSCNGDSGGPLMMQDTAGNWVQVGIVSWGREPLGATRSCGHQDLYAVYTRVSRYRGWIEQMVSTN